MIKLYEINYNENQWNIKPIRNSGYKFVNKKTHKKYKLCDNIIGITQVTDDEFLIYSIIGYDEWQPDDKRRIARVSLKSSKPVVMFKHDFYHFYHFLNEDLILFDDDAVLYSISRNEKDDILNHLFSKDKFLYDNILVEDRNIKFIYDSERIYPSHLLIEYKLYSGRFDIGEYLQVVIDISSFSIKLIYSTMRMKRLYLSSSLTLGQLVEKENYYAKIIGDFLFNFYRKDNRKNKDDLLAMIEESK